VLPDTPYSPVGPFAGQECEPVDLSGRQVLPTLVQELLRVLLLFVRVERGTVTVELIEDALKWFVVDTAGPSGKSPSGSEQATAPYAAS
jgi:hypothetical protein